MKGVQVWRYLHSISAVRALLMSIAINFSDIGGQLGAIGLCTTTSWPIQAIVFANRLESKRKLLVHPGCPEPNNHTETILIKTLLGPLALASYWLTLTS